MDKVLLLQENTTESLKMVSKYLEDGAALECPICFTPFTTVGPLIDTIARLGIRVR